MSSDLSTIVNGQGGLSVRTNLNTLITRFIDVINVKDYGALGDGSTDDTAAIQSALNAAYGTTGSPHGGTAPGYYSNSSVFFPPGHYIITSALTLRSVTGGHIFGSGRFTTTIQNTTTNGSVFVTNGFQYSRVEMINLVPNGTGVGFDLDWDNTGTSALQSNTFSDMFFNGGAYGLRIGQSGFMGSETLVEDCFFAGQTVAGLATRNGNALQQTVIGGNFQSCAIGIWVASGSVPVIHGMGFQGQTDTDIAVDNNDTPDCYSISGCRSESLNFVRLHAGVGTVLSSCTHVNDSAGVFALCEGGIPGTFVIASCNSKNGTITGNGNLYIDGGSFPSGFLSAFRFDAAGGGGGKLLRYEIPPDVIANLLTPAAGLAGLRMTVTNSNVVAAGNFGNIVAATGSNIVPVYCDGTHWRIG